MKSCLLAVFMCFLLLGGKAQRASAPALKEFEAFWKRLHTAIIKKDYQALSQYTEFPLVVKKSLADTTVQTVGREEFPAFFKNYLELPVAGDFGNKYELLRARKTLNEDDIALVTDDSASVEDFEFQKVNGGWKLVYVYATAEIE
ncbi:hypothetical protein [Chitinophaga sp.]|uniref:hypothetical protein n=1 Tax=Chitinophaga sp. TaxID=1869181 RepID=UPI0031D8CB45